MPKVLVIDDSATVRQVLTAELPRHGIEVVGSAPDPFAARDLVVQLKPDLVTLDIEMPRMDGLEFLRRLMAAMPLPVIVVSSVAPTGSRTALEAMELGALDVLSKPHTAYALGDLVADLAARIHALAGVHVAKRVLAPVVRMGALARTTTTIVAIGASTGGTEALRAVLEPLPADAPAIIVVQHMPPGFTRAFAQRLAQLCRVQVKEAEAGDTVHPGRVLLAPGDRHLLLTRSGAQYRVELNDGPRIGLHKPAVNVLFKSVARTAGANAVGALLTGMGRDGAEGLLEMRQAGARTLVQDEATSVVWGMPGAAAELGAAQEVLPLPRIAARLVELAVR
jgi:two-component system chemotaxis response regulator CheB